MISEVKTNSQVLEMVTCPICGESFPKKRKEMGYPYCIGCSTETKKVCLIEGIGKEGDSTERLIILGSEEAKAISKAINTVRINNEESREDLLDMRSLDAIEGDETQEGEMNTSEKSSLIAALEEEFSQGMSEVVIEEMIGMGFEEESEQEVLEDED